jgi:hypothetical protein
MANTSSLSPCSILPALATCSCNSHHVFWMLLLD